MFFIWPQYLWLLAASLVLLPAAYVWLLRRRRQQSLRYSSIGIVRAAAAGRHWRRHVPPALMLLALAGLLFGASRPVARIPMPWSRSTILLAIDVSLSMRVSDVKPTRLAAAQEAAKAFLREVPKHIEVGLVTFAGSTQVLQRATLNRETLVTAIDGFQMQTGTAIGSAIVQCLAELFPDQGIDIGELTFGSRRYGRSLDEKEKPPARTITPVPPGSYPSAAIILLSDGRRTTGIDTIEAAKMAADRGVRVYTIGLGTVNGDAPGPWGMPIWLRLDEPTLQEVARLTGGEYHYAGTADQLRTVYEKLGSNMQVLTRETELAGPIALVSALLTVLAAVLSVMWFRRLD